MMNDRIGLGALGLVVVGLAIVVWLALPNDTPPPPFDASADVAAVTAGDAAKPTATTLDVLPEATAELVVLTDKAEADVQKVATAEAVAKLLDVRHCGPACGAVKTHMADKERFEIEVSKADDYILPPKDSFETIAPGLTPQERASIGHKPVAVVVRARGPVTIDQIAARTGFAVTSAIAEALSGFVYDEVVRRIETSASFAQHVITVPLGQPVFAPKQILVQLYRQEDGTARLLTLGMVRFGSPDFTMRGSSMENGPLLANVVNVAASFAAAGKRDLPMVVTLDDVARVAGRKPEELAKNSRRDGASPAVHLDAAPAERSEGDPENDMLELMPDGGDTPEIWASALSTLFGPAPQVVFAAFDKELDAVAARARRDLPQAVRRFEAKEGALFVKGPFPIPPSSRIDGGASDEWMWIEVSSCDPKECTGALSNTPGYATNLAAGKTVKIERAKAADWLLRLPDGGAAGGESIRILQGRSR
jgi:uncharacterized protein YegJ (DUF2314 family)